MQYDWLSDPTIGVINVEEASKYVFSDCCTSKSRKKPNICTCKQCIELEIFFSSSNNESFMGKHLFLLKS